MPSTLLLEPGESIEVELVHADPDGVDSGGLAPEDAAIAFSHPGVVTMTELAPGRFRVTAGSGSGYTSIGATVPHADLTVGLMATVAELHPGVKTFDDSSVVWPRVDRDEAAPIQDFSQPYQSAAGVGPFSWARLRSLALTAIEDGGVPEVDEFPFVLVLEDSDLEEGDLVTSTGAASVLGEVTLVDSQTVDDRVLSLVVIELREPSLIFRSLEFEFSSDDLVEVGAASAPEAFGDEGVTTDMVMEGEEFRLPLPRVFGLLGAPAIPMATPPGASPMSDGETPIPVGVCRLEEGEIGIVDVSTGFTVSPSELPDLRAVVNIQQNSAMMEFIATYARTVGFKLDFSAQLSGSAQVRCGIADLPRVSIPAPPPVAAFLTFESSPRLFADLKVEGSGGPEFGYEVDCSATMNLVSGMRFNSVGAEPFKDLSDMSTEAGCENGPKYNETTGAAMRVELQASLGLSLDIPFDIRVGGPTLEKIASFFGDPDLFLIQLVSGSAGVKGNLAWANENEVIESKGSNARADMSVGLNFKFTNGSLKWFERKMLGGEVAGGIELPDISYENVFAQWFRGIGRDEPDPTVTVDGEPFEGVAAPGDRIEFVATTKAAAPKALSGLVRDFDVEQFRIRARVPNTTGIDQLLDLGTVSVTGQVQPTGASDGPTLTGHFTLTEEHCDLFEGGEVQIVVLSRSTMFVLPTAGYVTDFGLACESSKLEWSPKELSLEKDRTPSMADTVELRLFDPPEDVDTQTYNLSGTPDWLTVESVDGTNLLERGTVTVGYDEVDALTAEVRVQVDCDLLGDSSEAETVTAAVMPAGADHGLNAELAIDADCRELWTRVSPKTIYEPGGSLVISHSAGQKGETWSLGSPSIFTPHEGVFETDEAGGVAVAVSFERAADCDQSLSQKTVGFSLSSRHAKNANGELIYLPKMGAPCPQDGEDPEKCPPPPPLPPEDEEDDEEDPDSGGCSSGIPGNGGPGSGGGGGVAHSIGDPHLSTYDGLRFDMHVNGEYRYSIPDPDIEEVNAPTLHAQHTGYRSPTSKIKVLGAIALDYRGHRIEAYSFPEPLILIDGEEFDWVESTGGTLEYDLEFSIKNRQLEIGAGGFLYRVLELGSPGDRRMNITVDAPPDAPVRGIFGTPNGDPSDDLRTPDGTAVSHAGVRGLGYDAVLFSESWRVTDPDESLFSIRYDSWDEEASELDPALLQPYVTQVLEALEGVDAVCSGIDEADATSYEVLGIAIELYGGTPLEEALQFTCGYRVNTQVENATESFGLGRLTGLDVQVSAPGLIGCETTINNGGSGACDLFPDGEALAAGGIPVGPPEFTITVTHPVTGRIVATGIGGPEKRAKFGGAAGFNRVLTAPGTIEGSVVVSGTLTRHAEPITETTRVVVNQYDDQGQYIFGIGTNVTPDENGHYEFTRITHPRTDKLEILVMVGELQKRYRQVVTVDQTGVAEVDFDIAHDIPVVQVGGRWEGVPPKQVGFAATDAEGRIVHRRNIMAEVVDGRWSHDLELPASATELYIDVRASSRYPADNPSLTISDLTPGVHTRTLDVVVHPKMLEIEGTILVDGVAPTGQVPLFIEIHDEHGATTLITREWTRPDEATGRYLAELELPQETRSVTVTAQPHTAASTWTSTTAPVVAGENKVTLDAILERQVVEVSGRILVNGEPADGPIPLAIDLLDDRGGSLETWTGSVEPDAAGRVALDEPLVLPFGTVDLQVAAEAIDGMDVTFDETISVRDGRTEVDFDIRAEARFVTLDALLEAADGPFPAGFQLTWLVDGDPHSTSDTGILTPGVDGRVRHRFVQPAEVDGVDIRQSGYENTGLVRETIDFGEDPEVLIDWDGRPRQVELTGTVTTDGEPLGGVARQARLRALDDSGTELAPSVYRRDLVITTDGDGRYALTITVPEPAGSPTAPPSSWELVVEQESGMRTDIDLGLPDRGITDLAVDIAEVDRTPLTLIRDGAGDGGPIGGPGDSPIFVPPDLRVTAFSWEPGADDWAEEVIDEPEMVTTGIAGGFRQTELTVPPSTTFVRVEEIGRFDRVFQLEHPGEANTIDVSSRTEDPTGELALPIFDDGLGAVTISGEAGSASGRDYCGHPDALVFRAVVSVEGTDGIYSWTQTIGEFTIFPDADTALYDLKLPTTDWQRMVDDGLIPSLPDLVVIDYLPFPGYNTWLVSIGGQNLIPIDQWRAGASWDSGAYFACAN